MKNNKGEVIENTMEGAPKYYLHGSEEIQSSLQVQFEGLKMGDSKIIYLKKEDGMSGQDFTFDVVIDNLRPASEEEVLLGYPVVIDNLICDSDCDCYSSEDIDERRAATGNSQLTTKAK
jgi:FKBP-type peptidyl-prolyl cis-trans isomerase 2